MATESDILSPIRILRENMPGFRWRHLFSPKRRAIRKADTFRDGGDPSAAAAAYKAVIEKWGATFGLLMQYGNALKDSGSYAEADRIYLDALRIRPNDADVFLQRGHLTKLAGNLAGAEELYRQAIRLDPTFVAAQSELDALYGRNAGNSRKFLTNNAEAERIILRTDISMSASTVMHRITNQYRWRRG